MNLWRLATLAAGLALLLALAALDIVMAGAASSIKPLVALWLLVPAPLLFLLITVRPPARAGLRRAAYAYLGTSASLTMVVLLGVGWIGSERAIHPDECEDLPRLAEYPALQAKVQDVRFASQDGTRLAGWFVPGERKTTVLLLHGYGCTRADMLPHADMLHRAGYSVLLFDFRSRGESAGDAVTLGYWERGDVLGAIAYLKSRPDVDPSGFGVLGISLGGATAILAGAATQDIMAVVSESAFRSLNSVINQSFEHFINLPAFPFAPLTVWIAERRVGIRAGQVVPEREVAAIAPRPVFIMHGALDTTISPRDSQAIYAAAREPRGELWLIPSSAHAEGATKAKEEYERRIVAFFNAYLK
ncbi:MAG: alpha/beta hydrolase [Chloroflexi bacterium]|nr:alpha/beta hydrolase [Chloroflexota bacterium]